MNEQQINVNISVSVDDLLDATRRKIIIDFIDEINHSKTRKHIGLSNCNSYYNPLFGNYPYSNTSRNEFHTSDAEPSIAEMFKMHASMEKIEATDLPIVEEDVRIVKEDIQKVSNAITYNIENQAIVEGNATVGGNAITETSANTNRYSQYITALLAFAKKCGTNGFKRFEVDAILNRSQSLVSRVINQCIESGELIREGKGMKIRYYFNEHLQPGTPEITDIISEPIKESEENTSKQKTTTVFKDFKQFKESVSPTNIDYSNARAFLSSLKTHMSTTGLQHPSCISLSDFPLGFREIYEKETTPYNIHPNVVAKMLSCVGLQEVENRSITLPGDQTFFPITTQYSLIRNSNKFFKLVALRTVSHSAVMTFIKRF